MAVTEIDTPSAWDRQPGETARAYAAFRTFRDLGASRRLSDTGRALGHSPRAVKLWAHRWDWWERAEAWDAEQYRMDDAERLDAIRVMHASHRRAGRTVLDKAMAALSATDPGDIPPGVAVRLLDLGAKLERQTLTVSVHDLQGIDDTDENDPWADIAAELANPTK